MKKVNPRVLSLLLASLALVSAVGCTSNSTKPSAESTSTSTSTSTTSSTNSEEKATGVSYPIDTNETLTYWMELNPQNVAPNFTSINDTEFAKYLEEETGIKVEYIHPAVGNGPQAFNLLVASGNMPDIIDYGWARGLYPGGPEAALNNKVIIPLNDLIDSYAPDLKQILDENADYDKMVKTDSGTYYIFPVMKLDDYLNTTYGLVLRQDWLDELGLKMPVTIDDWHTVLTAFKEKKNADFPLTFANPGAVFNLFENGMFTGAYGFTKNWYLQDGAVTYGANQPAYKDWLVTMAQWYKEGLLDNNFATNDQATQDSNILNDEAGAVSIWLGSGLGKYLPELRAKNPKATLAAAPYPVLKEGDQPQFNSLLNPFDGSGACITTSCKNPELAVKFLNYGYTKQGRLTYGYGREGVSYTFDDSGVVQLTDEVTKNPDGWSIGQAWSKYAHGVYPGPYYSEKRFLEMYYTYPEQTDGLEKWTATNMRAHLLPPISPAPEEASEFARIMSDVKAYVDEYTLTAIMGTVDIESTFDEFHNQLNSLGIDKAIKIQQGALERYNKR